MKPVSLKRTAADRAEEKKEMTAEYKPPEYDYGTCLSLDQDMLKKLGLDVSKLAVGDKFNIAGAASVKAVSMSDREGGKARTSLELQITDLGVEKQQSVKKLASSMYPGMASGGDGGEG